MPTYEIHIKGLVQGVGFRPHVYRCAKALKICGQVSNDLKGVHIFFNADKYLAYRFNNKIVAIAPDQAIIESIEMHESTHQYFESFEIVSSSNSGTKEVRLSPDFGLCDSCMEDLNDADNKRHFYAFTTCTNCGPRYSIIDELPYDRPLTEMKKFDMCPNCLQEYNDPLNRRFYSQTNSCPDCAVKMSLYCYKTQVDFSQNEIIAEVIARLLSGQTVAVKGVGGYLLLCDASNTEAIQLLRVRKKRPEKPFAVLYPNLNRVKKDLKLTDEEAKKLKSTQAPIVLLSIKASTQKNMAVDNIAPGLDRIGVMLPYAPILYLISQGFNGPLVATSGNVSGSPIIYDDKAAIQELSVFSDCILTHDRKIKIPQDDSVVQTIGSLEFPIILRRSRGLAPAYFGTTPKDLPLGWLGLGAQMKSSFALSSQNQIYISQYLGNLDSYDAQNEFKHTLKHLQKVLDFKVTNLFADMHPQYFSHSLASELSKRENIPVIFIQHHKAHFAAVLQENQLLHAKEPVLGVIWDGTGLGEDGKIWGGEFFTYKNYRMKRTHHLSDFPIILGDKMALEPRLSALSLSHKFEGFHELLSPKFNANEWNIYNQRALKPNYWTTSMGRLFDGVSSILGLIDKVSYEGQAAMYLETKAREFKGKSFPYYVKIDRHEVSILPIVNEILSDLKKKEEVSHIAYRFHLTLVEIIRQVALISNTKNLAFSGGVFQNRLLVELIIRKLSSEFTLHFHQSLSPNDENIGFGQLIYGYMLSQQKILNHDQQAESFAL